MARHLFISQQTMTNWMDQDKIDFDGDVMTVKADGRAFRLLEAVRFILVEGDDEDSAGLLGKVKTDEQLTSIGAERYRDSVICQDVAYKVQEGFIGEVFVRKLSSEQEPFEAAAESPLNGASSAAIPEPDPAAEIQAASQGGDAVELPPPRPPVVPLPKSDLARTQPMEPVPENESASDIGAAMRRASGQKDEKKDGELSDEELLTNFLLENL